MTDTQHIYILLAVMVASGVLGGLVNYFGDVQASEKHPLLKRLSAGVAGAFVVPLFLNMISSTLIADSKSDELKLLIVAGFCIIASISSKAFIDSITKRLVNQVEEIGKQQKNLSGEVEPLIQKETEPTTKSTLIAPRYDINSEDKKVLKGLANPKWSLRSLNGISKETGFTDLKCAFILDKLCALGLTAKSTRDNNDRWWLTSEGRSLVLEI